MNLPNLYGGEKKNRIEISHDFCGGILGAHACELAMIFLICIAW